MTAYDNTIQDNAVQDRKSHHTSKHYISIGEGLRKSFNSSAQNNTEQDISKQNSTFQIFTYAYGRTA